MIFETGIKINNIITSGIGIQQLDKIISQKVV